MATIGKSVLNKPPSANVKSKQKRKSVDIRFIDDYYRKAKVVALVQSPFIYSLLANYRVIATDKVPIAAINAQGVLYLNPEGMRKAAPDPKQGVSILLHEALHPGLGHHIRGKNKHNKLYNIAGDCVINEALIESGFIIDLPIYKERGLIDARAISQMTGIDEEKIKSMDADDIYSVLYKTAEKLQGPPGSVSGGGLPGGQPQPGGQGQPGQEVDEGAKKVADGVGFGEEAQDINRDDVDGKGGKGTSKDDIKDKDKGKGVGDEGTVIQEGNPDIYREGPTGKKELDHKRALANAKMQADMQAGTMPAGLNRLVNGLLQPKVNWKSQLRSHLVRGMGSLVVTTWRKPSRRFPGMAPGHTKLTVPTIWVPIDTSGSVSEKQLKQALSEVYSIAKSHRAKIYVIPWDAEAYEILEVKTAADVTARVMPKMTGGGGTEIEPALDLILKGERGKKFKNKDVLLIISDGYIYDFSHGSVGEKLKILASKSSLSMFLTSGEKRDILANKLPSIMKIVEISD